MDCRVHLARLTLSGVLLCWAALAQAGLLDRPKNDQGIPSVDEAFELQAPLWDGKNLILRWDIAPGCYLYRDKLMVESIAPQDYALGNADLPAGEKLRDAHFGEVRVYRDSVQMRFHPISGQPPQTLRVRYQGCAEDKVCYPPQTRLLQLPPS